MKKFINLFKIILLVIILDTLISCGRKSDIEKPNDYKNIDYSD